MTYTGPLEDRIAIRELLETYADAVNQKDAVVWGSTWAEDSSWSLPEESGIGTIEGRERIIETWKVAMGYFPNVVFIATTGNIRIEGNKALMRSYTSEVYDDPATGQCRRDYGQYDDELIKVDQDWKFLSRRFHYLHRG
jgi:ketosteroid isomerase-like protein